MSEHNYTRALLGDGRWDLSVRRVGASANAAAAVESALSGKAFKTRASGTSFTYAFDDILTAGEITTLGSTVTSIQTAAATDSITQAKLDKQAAIDNRTEELIIEGFTYASKTFSLSTHAQMYWNGLGNLAANSLLTEPMDFPIRVNTLDDLDGYDIADIADAVAIFGAASNQIKTNLLSGTSLKDSVRAASDIAGVDAVTDTR